jgi:hypothetical protein
MLMVIQKGRIQIYSSYMQRNGGRERKHQRQAETESEAMEII